MISAVSMSGTRAAQREHTHWMRGAYRTRIERNSIWSVIVPADGTRAATVGNGDFGRSAFFGPLSDKPLLACR
jgi:hypothetical protein